jgi:hypothetical protein
MWFLTALKFAASYWKVIAIGIVIVAIGFMVKAYNTAIEDAALWESKYLTEKASREAKERANKVLEGELDQLVKEKEIIRRSHAAAVSKIKELKDEKGREWLDNPVPDSVLDILRQGNPGPGVVLPDTPGD